MENNQNNQGVASDKSSWIIKIKIAVFVLVGITILIVALFYGFDKFNQWKGERGVENLKKSLEKIEEEDYKLAMSDTYGGKTPQETLNMYIEAVEKEDYESASRCMVIAKQQEELENLKSSNRENIKIFMDILKKAVIVDKEKIFKESFDSATNIIKTPETEKQWIETARETNINRESMEIKLDNGVMSVSFWKYPSGNWKIQDF